MTIPFDVFAKSVAKADKSKNGDNCDYTILRESPLLVALALADGVGSKPCDDQASTVAVNAFLEHISKSTTKNIKRRLLEACEEADEQVANAPHRCQGMMTTFIAVVWEAATNQIHYTSVGDSRIYLQSAGQLEQLSTDDAIEQTKKIGAQTQLRSYITRALGTGTVQFDIQTQSFLPGETCWLASDGFYEAVYQVDKTLTDLWRYQDLNQGAAKLFKQYQPHYQDDASVVALRNNAVPVAFETDFRAWAHQNYPIPLPANLEQPACIRIIFDQLHQAVQTQEADEVLRLCELIEDLDIYPTLSAVEMTLGICQQVNFNDQVVYKALRGLLMKAVK